MLPFYADSRPDPDSNGSTLSPISLTTFTTRQHRTSILAMQPGTNRSRQRTSGKVASRYHPVLEMMNCMGCCPTRDMGGKKAVAIAQTAHLQLLSDGGCDIDILEYDLPASGADAVGGVIVHDFAVIRRVSEEARDASCFHLQRGIIGYQKHGIAPKASKLKWVVDSGNDWGGFFDGRENPVSVSIDKVQELMLISLAVVQAHSLSLEGMKILTEGWGFCMMFR